MLIVIHHFILHEPGFCLWCGHFPHFDSVLESVKAQVDCFKASHQGHLNKYKVFSFHSLRIIIHKRLQCATSQMGRFVAKWSNFLLICSRNRPDKNMPSYHYTNQHAIESYMRLKYSISERHIIYWSKFRMDLLLTTMFSIPDYTQKQYFGNERVVDI